MNRLVSRLAAGAPRTTLTRASPTLSRLQRSSPRCADGIRTIHSRLGLPYKVEEGMGKFLNPAGLKMIAEDYQQGLLDRLNDSVKDTNMRGQSVAQTVISSAQDPEAIMTFNYASEALNNSFFLQGLLPPKEGSENHEEHIDAMLAARIRNFFGTLDNLKSVFNASAMGMFGSGWVWLVCDEFGEVAVLPTFGTGTLLVRARARVLRGPDIVVGEEFPEMRWAKATTPAPPPPDAEGAEAEATEATETTEATENTETSGSAEAPPPSSPTSGISRGPQPLHPSTPSRTFSTSSLAAINYEASSLHGGPRANYGAGPWKNVAKTGDKLYPLMCISVHEHAWVGSGYGVWGKEEYVKNFWSVVNWNKVSEFYNMFAVKVHGYDSHI